MKKISVLPPQLTLTDISIGSDPDNKLYPSFAWYQDGPIYLSIYPNWP